MDKGYVKDFKVMGLSSYSGKRGHVLSYQDKWITLWWNESGNTAVAHEIPSSRPSDYQKVKVVSGDIVNVPGSGPYRAENPMTIWVRLTGDGPYVLCES